MDARQEFRDHLRKLVAETEAGVEAEADRKLRSWMHVFGLRLAVLLAAVSSPEAKLALGAAEQAELLRKTGALVIKVTNLATGQYRYHASRVQTDLKRKLFRQMEELIPPEKPAAP